MTTIVIRDRGSNWDFYANHPNGSEEWIGRVMEENGVLHFETPRQRWTLDELQSVTENVKRIVEGQS